MKHGPVLSNVFDLINYGSLSEKTGSWSSLISNPSGFDVSLERELSEEDYEELSVAERELLDEIWGKYGRFNEWKLVDLLHEVEEWQDPHGRSVPISYSEIKDIVAPGSMEMGKQVAVKWIFEESRHVGEPRVTFQSFKSQGGTPCLRTGTSPLERITLVARVPRGSFLNIALVVVLVVVLDFSS
jgi:Protein of unknown function (DUF4065)